jgi:putative flippase GtrA
MTAMRGQAGRFALVGVVNTLVDYLLFNGLVYLASLGVVPANIISGCAAIMVSFLLNRSWTFPESKKHGAAHHQFAKHLITTGIGLILATITVWLAEMVLEPYLAKLPAIFVTFVWNFTLSRHWVFSKRP